MNYSDVYSALQSGQLCGVGIDVYSREPFPLPSEDEFLGHPKVVSTPHVAGVTEISYRNMAQMVAENVVRLKKGDFPLGCVNIDDLGRETK